jgi:hypothetical protein
MSHILGALALYLDHHVEIVAHLAEDAQTFAAARAAQQAAHPERYAEFDRRIATIRARKAASAS